jgi:hypothetical protein
MKSDRSGSLGSELEPSGAIWTKEQELSGPRRKMSKIRIKIKITIKITTGNREREGGFGGWEP